MVPIVVMTVTGGDFVSGQNAKARRRESHTARNGTNICKTRWKPVKKNQNRGGFWRSGPLMAGAISN